MRLHVLHIEKGVDEMAYPHLATYMKEEAHNPQDSNFAFV